MSVFAVLGEDGSYSLRWPGYLVLVLVMLAVFVLGSSLFARNHKLDTREIAFSAVAIALATVTSMIKLIHMPMGGSVTLFSMFFITLIGYWYGLGAGLATASAYGLLQLILGPYIVNLPQLIVDYVLAFGALGLSGIFSGKKHGLVLGYLTGVAGRYIFVTLSGVIFFGAYAPDSFPNPLAYSLAYNGAYIGLEALITTVVLLIPPVASAVRMVQRIACGEGK